MRSGQSKIVRSADYEGKESTMLNLKTILVLVDFSEASLHALEHGVVMAGRFGANLVAAHVIAPLPAEYAAFDGGAYVGAIWPSKVDLDEEVKRRINTLVEKLKSERPIERVILHGDPAKELARFARERPVDMVMMPTHGYGPFRRFILGSVTAKVLHDVSCPVFTGTHMPEVTPFNPEPYKRIACAVDLSEQSEAVLEWAWRFAQKWEEDLIVIHAAPRMETGAAYGNWCPPDLQTAVVESAKQCVAELVRKVGCRAEVHVACADPVHYVRSIAEEGYADALVIGRSRDEGMLGRLRTHAYALIREAPCPLISV